MVSVQEFCSRPDVKPETAIEDSVKEDRPKRIRFAGE